MLILMFSTLIQVTFYTIASKLDNATDKFHKILIGFYGVLAAGFAAYVMLGGKELIPAVKDYFANPATHWVPFWGWLRGISYNAVNGNLAMSGIYLGVRHLPRTVCRVLHPHDRLYLEDEGRLLRGCDVRGGA